MQQRIGAIIGAYAEQGFHRTGTAVDLKSGEWLADEVRGIGLEPALEGFTLSRVDPVDASLTVNGRRIEAPKRLAPGDVVRIGETELRYEAA